MVTEEERQICDTCKFSDDSPYSPGESLICREKPPTVVTNQEGEFGPAWPEVSPFDWCGHWSASD